MLNQNFSSYKCVEFITHFVHMVDSAIVASPARTVEILPAFFSNYSRNEFLIRFEV